MGRVGSLARPVGWLSFAADADTVLAARVHLSGAETMHELNETLRAITGGMHAHFTGPGVALEVTLGRRQELPIHEAHTAGLTRLFRHAAGTIGARSTPGGGPVLPLRRDRARPALVGAGCRAGVSDTSRRTPVPHTVLLDGVGHGRGRAPKAYAGRGARSGRSAASGERRPSSTARSCSQSTSGRAAEIASTEAVM
ncbi:hypothetical protein [Streptomyces eurythermus]|uniref:hypothetical protein n=1 Tax=Streptomyces eurythermus TaxID=42237 RepID=UPI0033D07E9D